VKSAGPGRGTNSVNLRLYNERTLLQRLRRAGEASKADLARWAQLTNTAVGSIVQSLEESRLIEPAGLAQPYNLGSWLRELDLKADFRVWDEVDFGTLLSQAVEQPVFKENDGNAAAIAETFFGVGREENDFLYVFIGAALGAGAVIGGESLRGSSGNAADLGLMPVPPSRLASAPVSGRPWDILLSRASLNSLARHLRHHGIAVRNHADLAACVQSGRAEVREWLDDCVDALVPSIRASLAVLDLPAVVIDCDIDSGIVDELMKRVDAGLRQIAPEARQNPRILRGTFRADAGAIGAASLPMFFNFSPRADVLRGRPHHANLETASV
jgi:predicted NBD/HSP70 family sugar kinase